MSVGLKALVVMSCHTWIYTLGWIWRRIISYRNGGWCEKSEKGKKLGYFDKVTRLVG